MRIQGREHSFSTPGASAGAGVWGCGICEMLTVTPFSASSPFQKNDLFMKLVFKERNSRLVQESTWSSNVT